MTSKSQLLAWINEFLGLSYTHIEQTCSGVVALQTMDAVYPGAVPLHKVNFNAKVEYEFIKNLKVLQAVFVKLSVPKEIEIEKLTKGKYQDNLEFMQWLKTFCDANYKGGYDAVARRQHAIAAAAKGEKEHKEARPRLLDVSNTMASENDAPNPTPTKPPVKDAAPKAPASNRTHPPATTPAAPLASRGATAPPTLPSPGHGLAGAMTPVQFQRRVDALSKQLAEQKERADIAEKQRNFFYGKLRNIEVVLDEDSVLHSDPALLRTTVQSILFNPDGDFVVVDSTGAMETDP